MENIFKHNSRTYRDVYDALIAAYPTAPVWLFEEMAGLFDFQSELQNRIATDILSPSTRESAYHFAALCDYEPSESSGATVSMTITLTSAMAKTLTAGYQVGGISSKTGDMAVFELTADASSGGTDTITGNFEQKKSEIDISIGIVDNQNDYMDYAIGTYGGIIKTSLTLKIDAVSWTRVENFDNSIISDKHFILLYQSNGKARIQFGNGTNGLKPSLNGSMVVNFAITLGLDGRMEATEINLNIGNDGDIESLTNVLATSGGNNPESIASIIRNARGNVRLRDIIWSKEDLVIASRQASSSVVKALGIPGIGSAVIHIIPSGGGVPSAGLKTIVDDYVTAKTQFGTMPITVSDPNYKTQNIAATVTARTGFVLAKVQDLVRFAMTLVSCAYDSQVLEYYDDNGIDSCRINVINILWAWAFVEADNDALEYIITQWKSLLGSSEYRNWGQPLEIGDLWILGNGLIDYGVDVFNLTNPIANVTTTSTEIINTGTLTIT